MNYPKGKGPLKPGYPCVPEYTRVLQRKHYEELAKAVAAWGQERIPSDQYFGDFVDDLCNVLEKTNPVFSRAQFVKACMEGRD